MVCEKPVNKTGNGRFDDRRREGQSHKIGPVANSGAAKECASALAGNRVV
jgi:hypothetical protein